MVFQRGSGSRAEFGICAGGVNCEWKDAGGTGRRRERGSKGNLYVAGEEQAGRGEGIELKYNYIAKYIY